MVYKKLQERERLSFITDITCNTAKYNAQKIKFYIKNIFIFYAVKGVAMSISRTDKKNISEFLTPTMREKCPNTEVFLVRIFPHSD